MRQDCYLCHRPLKRTGCVTCAECAGKYSSLNQRGLLPIGKTLYKELQSGFTYDEVNVVI